MEEMNGLTNLAPKRGRGRPKKEKLPQIEIAEEVSESKDHNENCDSVDVNESLSTKNGLKDSEAKVDLNADDSGDSIGNVGVIQEMVDAEKSTPVTFHRLEPKFPIDLCPPFPPKNQDTHIPKLQILPFTEKAESQVSQKASISKSVKPNIAQIRLKTWDDIIGQKNLKKQVMSIVQAAQNTGKSMGHVLLIGSSGLGKTAFADVIANQLGVNRVTILGQTFKSTGKFYQQIFEMEDRDILFVDEVHELDHALQTALYTILDRNVVISPNSSTQIPVANITLLLATSIPGRLLPAFTRRMKRLNMELYSNDELGDIVKQRCQFSNWKIDSKIISEIAKRGRKTPSEALRILNDVITESEAKGDKELTESHLASVLKNSQIDSIGLNYLEQQYMQILFREGASQVSTVACKLCYDSNDLIKTIEPYLIHEQLVRKKNSLRVLTEKGLDHVKMLNDCKTTVTPTN